MGYVTHIVVVDCHRPQEEYERDFSRPYSDGSGYERKVDENGDMIPTGRQQIYCQTYGEVVLGKIYESKLSDLHSQAAATNRARPNQFYFRYHSDGNTEWTEDAYGDPFCVAGIDEAIEAIEADIFNEDSPYEYSTLKWAHALRTSMKQNHGDYLKVLFYGS